MASSTYAKLLRSLFSKKRNVIKNSESVLRMEKACKFFGNPQDKFDSIHIAGTNGKGSVTFKLSEIFRLSGYKSGLYTSPHLHTYRERIQINRQMISENETVQYLSEIINSESKFGCILSFFDITTLACFLYFANRKIDIGLMETGIGGLHDSTNIMNPLISVITSIGEDHKDTLGSTLNEIAEVKAGIIKLNRPCIVGMDLPIEIFKKKCKEMNSDLYQAEESLKSSFNDQHEKIIDQVLKVVKNYYPRFTINPNIIKSALSQSLPCRKQTLLPSEIYDKIKIRTKAQALIFDAGHNPPAIEHLLLSLGKEFHKKARIIISVSKEKDYKKIVEILEKYSSHIYPIHGKHPRLLDPSILYECVRSFNNVPVSLINRGNIKDSIIRSLLDANENEIVLVCGSFYIMSEAYEVLNIPVEKDPDYMN